MKIYWVTEIRLDTLYKASRIELSKALRKRGHSVTLILQRTINEKNSLDKNYLSFPTIDGRIIYKFIFGFYIFFYLPFLMVKEKPNLIIVDGVDIWLPFILPLKILGVPLILDVRSFKQTQKLSFESFFFSTSLFLTKFLMDGITTITPELKDKLIRIYKIRKEKIGIWSSGVSLENFTHTITSNNFIVKNRKPDSFIIMYHGSYSQYRGIENIILSLKNLEGNLRDKILVVFVGFKDKEIEHLEGLCNDLGVREQVTFVPQVTYEKLPSFITMCDVGIIPLPPESEWCRESSPLKTLEYLAMGKPIIATSIPFHKRIFAKGQCGVLIENSNPESITAAIRNLYENKAKLNDMGRIGRKIVEDHYTWDRCAQDLEELIQKVITDEIK